MMKTKRRAALVLALTALSSIATAQSGGNEPDAKNVELVLQKYIQSVKTADVALAGEIWSHSSDIIVVTPFGRFQGWEDVRESLYVNFLQKSFSERNLQPSNVAIRVAGDAAWAVFDWTFTGKFPNGQTMTSKGWESHVYRRTPAGWVIAALHYSVPPPTP